MKDTKGDFIFQPEGPARTLSFVSEAAIGA